jgi:L-asparaginase II
VSGSNGCGLDCGLVNLVWLSRTGHRMSEKLPVMVEVRRGQIVEARHRGAIVAVEPDGRALACFGDDSLITPTRSAIKPIQAIPLITSGAADRFQITSRELAVICASHDGEPIHTEAVSELLAKIGLSQDALMCGIHPPYSKEIAREMERRSIAPTQVHNNCSGKHAGMLAVAVHSGVSTSDYIWPDHPVQRAIISIFTRISGLRSTPPIAIDGCSAPTFGVPIKALALSFARIANPWSGHDPPVLDWKEAEAAKRIVAAMTAHPEMVGGTKGRLDTDLMRTTGGKLIAKVGAMGVYAIGILPGKVFPRGLGIAIKIEDGSREALAPAVVETLVQLGVLDQREKQQLASYHLPTVKNRRGLAVGEIRPVFDLV